MLKPCLKAEGARYLNRQGEPITPPANAVFYKRLGGFIIFDIDQKILLMRPVDGEGLWELPGGGVDEGEDFEAAAIRETMEETGFDITGAPLQKAHTQKVHIYIPDEPEFWNYDQTYFILKDSSYNALIFEGIRPAPEDGEIQWVALDDLKNTPLKAPVVKALEALGYLD